MNVKGRKTKIRLQCREQTKKYFLFRKVANDKTLRS
ncbi:hypothetical protein NIASO_01345 [Niabella soli DSM 19437]|uniref:Uncharacterized protein n=1 Tax=Niabella soli DSM 19437 TaxID=929713 RepID=W0F6S3_9BACT|nr:hypothetical protein NIASO_01345 [Niabella soli DSM 19437]